jgi:hypothetical protein
MSTVPYSHKFRFRAAAAANALQLGVGGIFGALGVVATSTTSVASIASSFRVHSISMYPSAATTPPSECLCLWASALTGFLPDEARLTTMPDGITIPRGYKFSPPKASLAADWINTAVNAGAAVVYLTCPTGTIIDIHLSARMSNAIGNINITVTSAGVGGVYYLAPDGPATNRFVPLGLVTTH